MIKSSFFYLSALALLSMVACTQAPDSDKATTSEAQEVSGSTTPGETWAMDLTASKVKWVGTKLSGYHTGAVPLKSGELQVLNGEVTGGKFAMDLGNLMVTGPKGSDQAGNAKLTGHLKSPDFFDAANYPEATFVITAVDTFTGEPVVEQEDRRQDEISEYKVSSPTHTISGNLTIKNITKNIQFPARIMVMDNTVNAMAKFNIDRTLWGLTYTGKPDDLIRNEIHLGIALKATK